MSKVLVIVESPAKAKTISKFLGNKKYMVKASMGHVRDLPKSQFGVDVDNDFTPKYIAIRGKGEVIKDLRSAAQKADKVLLASDPDREGEAIAWHLQHLLNIDDQEKCRIEFNEITKNAIQSAVKHARRIDYNRVDAQQARRVLDRLVGYNLSPLLWRKIRKGLSAGRVQSVAVRLICDREEEINAFVPQEYWSLTARLKAHKGILDAKLYKKDGSKIEVENKAQMDRILQEVEKGPFVVARIKKREQRRNPAPPFITSSLQQEAYRKLNFTARRTMMIAQQLYEGLDLGKEGSVGLITYIRTDSTRVSEVARQEAKDFIMQRYGAEFIPGEAPRSHAPKGKVQNAHEAIRPTSVFRVPDQVKEFLSKDQFKLYKLVWERFIASQMAAAVLDLTTLDIDVAGYTFRASGSVIKFRGFMEVYTEGKDEDVKEADGILPDVTEGQELSLVKLDPKQHFTQPPPRYTEATLVKTLEEKGIGRPSTYAPIIETILSRGYVVREEKQFYPTELGFIVVDLLKENFRDIIDVEFTAELEKKLDLIEEGQLEWKDVIRNFYEPFSRVLAQAEEKIGRIEVEDEVTEEKCDKCGRNMVVKMGRFGKFLACPGFPDCRNTKPLLEGIGVSCPECGGEIVVRRTKKGRKFFGCSNYPECEFISWNKPTGKKCPECNGVLVEKVNRRKGGIIKCSGEKCQYEEIIPQS